MFVAMIINIEPLNDYIYRIVLSFSHPFIFKAGQYIEMVLPCGKSGYFSIASLINCGRNIELHISDTKNSNSIIRKLKVGNEVKISQASGNAWLRATSDRSMLIVAFGSGFSYARSILLSEALSNSSREVYFYWIMQSKESIYELYLINSLPERFKCQVFHYRDNTKSKYDIGRVSGREHTLVNIFP
ncbi:hypothetical protein [Xenorhabdus kozodoii]|uniref:CDP-6-deoxy-delta-3,4-glucoseen reductase n=1 Tax=Xenorhabdus kozodoii TaxID=351676 RepID=A0A2D0L2V4_9GAMM|nr:hypothetical protein [Xenorhabdus kozodoii]PHM70011.1 CDP-6-deoxy-delta-3,4-glucoseen reductase [Xenorhabdus kozodoii]